jgi:hypothetical protein
LALSTEDLFDKALHQAGGVNDDNFLELGRSLRQLQDRDPELFKKIVSKSDVGRRKAYYLVEVSRTFDPLPVPRSRLKKIKWTKLQLIGKYVKPDNLEELLTLAETHNAKELQRHLRGEKTLGGNAHCVLMYFSPKDYEEVEEELVKHGAKHSTGSGGRVGLSNKESALLSLIRKIKETAS